MDDGLLLKIALLCKNYLVLRTIDLLFLTGGAKRQWWQTPEGVYSSERVERAYGWIEGIQHHAPQQLESILLKVIEQLVHNDDIPENERQWLQKQQIASTPTVDDDHIALEPLLATVVRLLSDDGKSREVAILAHAKAKLIWTDHDRALNLSIYDLHLQIPHWLYAQVKDELDVSRQVIFDAITPFNLSYAKEAIASVIIAPMVEADDEWRDKARAWVDGKGVSNQGGLSNRVCIWCPA